jgi:hypothetical protein
MTIKGWGFEHTDLVTVTVAGVDCTVVSSTMEEIKCITGASSQSVDGVN